MRYPDKALKSSNAIPRYLVKTMNMHRADDKPTKDLRRSCALNSDSSCPSQAGSENEARIVNYFPEHSKCASTQRHQAKQRTWSVPGTYRTLCPLSDH